MPYNEEFCIAKFRVERMAQHMSGAHGAAHEWSALHSTCVERMAY